jgi:hypothetical protein
MIRNFFVKAVVLTAVALFPIMVFADNFFIPYHPTSDPAPSVFTYNGETRVYFYCTQDMIGSSGSIAYPIDTIHCYSSADMFHWRDEGVALDEKSCPNWVYKGGHQLWAPHCVYLKGRYCLYAPEATTSAGDQSAYCFLSTSATPKGPFTPAASYFSASGIGAIDPFCFVDSTDSVRVYMAWRTSSGRQSMIRMNDSGNATVGSQWQVSGLENQYQEGTWLFKYSGYYYLVYATSASGNEIIAYATAPVPATGGIKSSTAWTTRGQIIASGSDWTIHSGLCLFAPAGATTPQWYVFWHGVSEIGPRLFGAGHGRCTAIETMSFGTGTPALINSVTKTYRGVGICSAATDSIQVDRYSSISGAGVSVFAYGAASTEAMGWYVSNITNNSNVQYNNVSFTPIAGYRFSTVQARVGSTGAANSIQVKVGSTVVGTIAVPNTNGLTTWQTTAPVNLAATPPTGTQNLTLTFTMGTANSMNVNWIKFGQALDTDVLSGPEAVALAHLSCHRADKNTFIFDGVSGRAPTVKLFNLTGREMADAFSSKAIRNTLTVALNAKMFVAGTYVLQIKTRNGDLKVPFTY